MINQGSSAGPRENGRSGAVVLPEGAPSLRSRMSWGAVIAGAIVAVTIGLMLNALGAGIGATAVDAAARDTPAASSFGIGAAVWVLISNLIGLAVGGYVAARLSGTADNTDGTLHGLAVWGTTFLISAVLLGNLVAGVTSTAVSGASSLVGSVAQGAGSAVSAVGEQAANRTDTGTLQSTAQGLINRVQGALDGAGRDPAAMNSDQRRAEMGTLVTRRVTDGELSPQDRERLNRLVAAEYNLNPQEAQQRVQEAEQQATEAARQAEETARNAADAAATGAATASFAIFGIMLLGAIAAILGARRGTRPVVALGSGRVA
ncbi:tellurite resistance TerB family protein [Teichococcus vastitatis]|uniref:PhnA-like protein n=1 Tax=Teichococcus vastitatis TaxID=2307076 RepID=A0ABS9WEM0_9PROT|nr:hypothetical protein [Pseudoroseomonas vastitatis]MCI0757170.1 hypothetical protein [Pseudoroseomonas vastitatis]